MLGKIIGIKTYQSTFLEGWMSGVVGDDGGGPGGGPLDVVTGVSPGGEPVTSKIKVQVDPENSAQCFWRALASFVETKMPPVLLHLCRDIKRPASGILSRRLGPRPIFHVEAPLRAFILQSHNIGNAVEALVQAGGRKICFHRSTVHHEAGVT
jgi:hypothetical protein